MDNQTTEMHIRPYDPSDEKRVIELWQQCGLVVPQNDPHRDIALKMQVQPDLFLTGSADNRIVATVMAGYDGHRGWINYLAVLPGFRKKGYGRQIMVAAEKRLKAMGCPKINLQVRSSNTAALGFYSNIGFSRDDVISLGKRL